MIHPTCFGNKKWHFRRVSRLRAACRPVVLTRLLVPAPLQRPAAYSERPNRLHVADNQPPGPTCPLSVEMSARSIVSTTSLATIATLAFVAIGTRLVDPSRPCRLCCRSLFGGRTRQDFPHICKNSTIARAPESSTHCFQQKNGMYIPFTRHEAMKNVRHASFLRYFLFAYGSDSIPRVVIGKSLAAPRFKTGTFLRSPTKPQSPSWTRRFARLGMCFGAGYLRYIHRR